MAVEFGYCPTGIFVLALSNEVKCQSVDDGVGACGLSRGIETGVSRIGGEQREDPVAPLAQVLVSPVIGRLEGGIGEGKDPHGEEDFHLRPPFGIQRQELAEIVFHCASDRRGRLGGSDALTNLFPDKIQHIGAQGLLRGEEVAQGACGDAGLGGDIADRELGDPLAYNDPPGCLADQPLLDGLVDQLGHTRMVAHPCDNFMTQLY